MYVHDLKQTYFGVRARYGIVNVPQDSRLILIIIHVVAIRFRKKQSIFLKINPRKVASLTQSVGALMCQEHNALFSYSGLVALP